MMKKAFNRFYTNNDLNQCKNDLLYLTEEIDNWKEKQFLYPALISHLTGSPFYYSRDIAIKAYEQLTGTEIKIVNGYTGEKV